MKTPRRDREIKTMVADGRLGIAAMAVETMAGSAGLTPKELIIQLVGLYWPEELEKFLRRVHALPVPKDPPRRLVKILTSCGMTYDEPSGRFVKK